MRSEIRRNITAYWNKLRRFYFWTIPFIVAIVTAPLDPFGIVSASEEASIKAFNRIVSPFYQSEAYNETVVVLLDDEYLEQVGDVYPMQRINYYAIFDYISRGEPDAIFIDIHYPDNRDDESTNRIIGEYLASLSRNPLQNVEVADSSNPYIWVSDLGGGLEAQSHYTFYDQVPSLPVKYVGHPSSYPLCISEDWHPSACTFDGARKAPAYELYTALCGQGGRPECASFGHDKPMFVEWSRRPEPGMESVCAPDPQTFLGDLALSARLFVNGFKGAVLSNTDIDQNCFPFQTIRAVNLELMNEKALKDAFHGRTVFFGALFSQAPDIAFSSVHGALPGVYVHAMAYDNIVTHKDRYWIWDRDIDRDTGFTKPFISLNLALNIICLFLALLVYLRAASKQMFYKTALEVLEANPKQAHLHSKPHPEIGLANKRLLSAVLHSVLLLSFVIICGLVLPAIFRVLPTNFYGQSLLVIPIALSLFVSALIGWIAAHFEHSFSSAASD